MNSYDELAVGKKGRGISLIWIAPILAVLITAGMIWKNYVDAGTRITIVIENGDGIREGKTPIMYKGIKVGVVEEISIKEDDVSKIELTVMIDKKAAEGIARKGNKFWKVEPKVSITEVSGLGTIITGVYIAVMPAANNKEELYALPYEDNFVALTSVPVDVFDPGLLVIVNSVDKGDMAIGAPVLYNKQVIGKIEDKKLSSDKKSTDLFLRIDTEYMDLVHERSLFYKANAIDVQATLSSVKVQMGSFASFIAGGIVLHNSEDSFASSQAREKTLYHLYGNYEETMQNQDEIILSMEGYSRLEPGSTKVFYKGVEAGLVEELQHDPAKAKTLVKIKLYNDFRKLANEKAFFWVVSPKLGFDKVDGLDAVLRGNYINYITTDIKAKASNNFVLHEQRPGIEGVHLKLIAKEIKSLKEGSGVFYHGIEIGQVVSYCINEDKKSFTVDVSIEQKYKDLLNTSSLFYHKSGIEIKAGVDGVNLSTGGLESVLRGGLAVETPDFKAEKSLKDSYFLHTDYEQLQEQLYLNKEGIYITLIADQMGSLKKGSPVYYKQIKVGRVLSFEWNEKTKQVFFNTFITKEYANEVHNNSLFYIASGIDAKFGLDGLEINTESLETVITGGIAFYTPMSQEGKAVRNHEQFKLYETKSKAMNKYVDIVLYSTDSHGLVAGNLVMYKSVIIGHVSDVRLEKDKVELDVKVESKYAYLLKEDTLFWPEAFEMSLQGIQNFSAALKGTFIVLKEGESKKDEDYFILLSKKPSSHFNEPGLRVVVKADRLGSIKEDTPLYYRQIQIGSVSQYRLSDDSTGVDIELFIEPCYAYLIRSNSYFYNAGGVGMEVDLFGAKLKTETLDSILTGGIAVLTPNDYAEQAKESQLFILHEDVDKNALTWSPKLKSSDPMCQ